MPIISGGSGGGAGGTETLLSTTTLASDTTFDVSGISQAFNDLRLVVISRSLFAGGNDTLAIRFNNDSTAGHYSYGYLFTTGNTPQGNNTASSNQMLVCWIYAATATAGFFSATSVLIPGYANTTWAKTAAALSSAGGVNDSIGGGTWNDTSAINRIQVFGNSGVLKTGSQLRIYGVL